MSDERPAEAGTALSQADAARAVAARAARRAVRRNLVVFGSVTSLAILMSGMISSWDVSSTTQSLLNGLLWMVLAGLLLAVDRSAPVRPDPARRSVFVTLAVAALVALPILALARDTSFGPAIAAAATAVTFATAAWWVGR